MVGPPSVEYIHSGGNRQPAAADWDARSGILAFGTDQNVAIWRPLEENCAGISAILKGHTDTVNAVKFLPSNNEGKILLLTGSADSTVQLWDLAATLSGTICLKVFEGHNASVNAIATNPESNVFVTAAADSSVCVWRLGDDQQDVGGLVTSFRLSPSYIPLALVLHTFPKDPAEESLILAVAGTTNSIQLFTLNLKDGVSQCTLQATLSGHEGWIRSLTACTDCKGDVLLASASQDKYVRLWRISRSTESGEMQESETIDLIASAHPLKAKVQKLQTARAKYNAVFEALLLGHEDWIYSVTWTSRDSTLQLLTASADNSLSIWEADEVSGIWTSATRLGEISEQKGSTTATGSSGGLWAALWSPDGYAIACLGRSGSWRLWQYDLAREYWDAKVGISGHTRPVSDIAWEPSGQYLLSTSLDQTSRLHAPWQKGDSISWHEFSRPQIHGYDLNCIGTLGRTRFVSGADEKLLRVFDEPKAIGLLLERLCRIVPQSITELPEAADVPVLGLSNKAVDEEIQPDADVEGHAPTVSRTQLDMDQPPPEDQLARHTLWPEIEKLYGHGYEISSLATSHDYSLIATACKASSIDHAVIRLYDTSDWHEIRPSLTAHTLTITRLRFSPDDNYLLSVGRDRQWSVFARSLDRPSTFSPVASNPRGHSRMILDAAWAPISRRRTFATAGRDKLIKIWQLEEGDNTTQTVKVALVVTISRPATVTAIDFAPMISQDGPDGLGTTTLAVGEDGGQISLHTISLETWEVRSVLLESTLCPSKSVTRLAWRPQKQDNVAESSWAEDGAGQGDKVHYLGAASADCSLRLIRIEG